MDDQRVTRQGAEHRDIVGCLDLETAPRQGEAGHQAQPGPQSQPGAVHQIERGSTIVISEEPIRSFFRRIGLERRLQAGSASSGRGCGRDSLRSLDPGQRFQLGHDQSQGGTIKGVTMQRFGVQHKLAAFGLRGRGRHQDLAAELVRRPGLNLAGSIRVRGVQRIDLGAALPGANITSTGCSHLL